MTDLLADAPFVGLRETPYSAQLIVAYVQQQIRRYWYDDWARRAQVQASSNGRGEWSVSVEWPDVPWIPTKQPNSADSLSRVVPDLTHPGSFTEETRIVPAPLAPMERPRPDRGRKVPLPTLDTEELSTLLSALSVYASETGHYGHTVAYLERMLRRAIKESEGAPDA